MKGGTMKTTLKISNKVESSMKFEFSVSHTNYVVINNLTINYLFPIINYGTRKYS